MVNTLLPFKLEAVKQVERTETVAKVAGNSGINVNTLHGWIQRYREQRTALFGERKIKS
ncbi:hypothetical protein MASR2M79_21910 [Aminivibrio sp.]